MTLTAWIILTYLALSAATTLIVARWLRTCRECFA